MNTEMADIVQRAVARGAIRLPAPFPPKPRQTIEERRRKNRLHMETVRQANLAAGLTGAGRPRKNRPHPELRGLSRGEYMARYMREIRHGRKAAPTL